MFLIAALFYVYQVVRKTQKKVTALVKAIAIEKVRKK
jgi:hypothetical protein